MGSNVANLDALLQGSDRVVAIDGHNFSGRTRLFRNFCATCDGRIYIGPEVYNALSGLTSSVQQEIELHGGPTPSLALQHARGLGLVTHLGQHPGTLSGGEQACLAVLCGLALAPRLLAVDCGLEQLDDEHLTRIVRLLIERGPPEGTLVTDNRLHDWPIPVQSVPMSSILTEPRPSGPIRAIDPGALRVGAVTPAPSITFDQVSAGYRGRPNVLHSIGFTLCRGLWSLHGANGAGKSTLAKVLSGILKPSSGRVLVDGQPIEPWRRPARLMAYHLQNPDVSLFESTVLGEIRSGRAGDPDAHELALSLASAFGLTDVLHLNPLAVPFPARKRVSLAATLACPAPWCFLDEPALGADRENTNAIASIIREFAAAGRGVIVVSHSRSFHRAIGGRSIYLHDGCLTERAS